MSGRVTIDDIISQFRRRYGNLDTFRRVPRFNRTRETLREISQSLSREYPNFREFLESRIVSDEVLRLIGAGYDFPEIIAAVLRTDQGLDVTTGDVQRFLRSQLPYQQFYLRHQPANVREEFQARQFTELEEERLRAIRERSPEQEGEPSRIFGPLHAHQQDVKEFEPVPGIGANINAGQGLVRELEEPSAPPQVGDVSSPHYPHLVVAGVPAHVRPPQPELIVTGVPAHIRHDQPTLTTSYADLGEFVRPIVRPYVYHAIGSVLRPVVQYPALAHRGERNIVGRRPNFGDALAFAGGAGAIGAQYAYNKAYDYIFGEENPQNAPLPTPPPTPGPHTTTTSPPPSSPRRGEPMENPHERRIPQLPHGYHNYPNPFKHKPSIDTRYVGNYKLPVYGRHNFVRWTKYTENNAIGTQY